MDSLSNPLTIVEYTKESEIIKNSTLELRIIYCVLTKISWPRPSNEPKQFNNLAIVNDLRRIKQHHEAKPDKCIEYIKNKYKSMYSISTVFVESLKLIIDENSVFMILLKQEFLWKMLNEKVQKDFALKLNEAQKQINVNMDKLILTLLKSAYESDSWMIGANKFRNLTKAKDNEINKLKILCNDYGDFSGKGFGDLNWEQFILNANGISFIKNSLNIQNKQDINALPKTPQPKQKAIGNTEKKEDKLQLLSKANTVQQSEWENPKVFISYSYDDKQHEQWVESFAAKLKENNINVILDKWHTRLGQLLPNFMEQSVANTHRVICILTPNYKKKADKLSGGVGYEYSIITAEIFKSVDTIKFIPLLRNGNDNDAIPISLNGRKYLDMRNDENFDKSMNDLLEDLTL